jgi:hypothetical protein
VLFTTKLATKVEPVFMVKSTPTGTPASGSNVKVLVDI